MINKENLLKNRDNLKSYANQVVSEDVQILGNDKVKKAINILFDSVGEKYAK